MQALFEFLIGLIRELWPLVIVDPWERGIRVRLGRWVKDVGPGLHISLPFADAVHTVNVKRQAANMPAQSLWTLDGSTVVVKGAVEYTVSDARLIWLRVQDHDESLLEVIGGLIAEFVSESDVNDLSVKAIERGCIRKVRREGRKWGIEVKKVYISDLAEHKPYRIMLDGGLGLD